MSNKPFARFFILSTFLASFAHAQSGGQQLKLPEDYEIEEDEDYIDPKGKTQGPSKPTAPRITEDITPVDPRERARQREGYQEGYEQRPDNQQQQQQQPNNGAYFDPYAQQRGGFDPYRQDPYRQQGQFRQGPMQQQQQQPLNQDLYTPQVRRNGNECQGARSGDFVHAVDLSVKVFRKNDKYFASYPVFTLAENLDERLDNEGAHQDEVAQQRGGPGVDPRAMAPMGPGGMVAAGGVVPAGFVAVRSIVPMRDALGRPMMGVDRFGRPVPMMHEQVFFVPGPMGPGGRPFGAMIPGGPMQGGQQMNADCLALPFLRTEEVHGAHSMEDALRILSRGRQIKRESGRASKERTPQNLGPIASSDPGVVSK